MGAFETSLGLIGTVLGVSATVIVYLYQRFKNEKKELQEEIGKLYNELNIGDEEVRNIETVRKLQKRAANISQEKHVEVFINGVNALSPLHQGMESLIEIMDNGGEVKVMVLDGDSDYLLKRIEEEEGHRDKEKSRIMKELEASLSIMEDIKRHSKDKGNLELRRYSEPIYASIKIPGGEKKKREISMVGMVVDDGDEVEILVNPRSDEKEQRQLKSVQFRLTNRRLSHLISVKHYLNLFREKWEEAKGD